MACWELAKELGKRSRDFFEFVMPAIDMVGERNDLVVRIDLPVAIALINAYSEFVNSAPKMIEYWYNLFLNPSTRTEEQRRDKVKVE